MALLYMAEVEEELGRKSECGATHHSPVPLLRGRHVHHHCGADPNVALGDAGHDPGQHKQRETVGDCPQAIGQGHTHLYE